MDEKTYNFEFATWYDIERNKMHLKRDGEHYVADAMLFRENANLRQENESLKKENDGLRREINRLVMNSMPTATELRRVRSEWKKDRDENEKLKRRLEILKDHGIEIADAVAGGFEIYNKEHARADRLQAENAKLRELCKSMRCALADHEDKVYLTALDKTLIDTGFDLQKLGIEVD